ncbi:MAG: glycosyltransferase [Phycisphaerales bacterium]
MRILLVNWAPIAKGAAVGGGVNGYAQSLALELVRLGHDVVSLCGGTKYEPGEGGKGLSREPGPPRIVRHEDWRGIRLHEVLNSPVLAPSINQFNGPAGEVAHAELERLVAEFVAHLQPDAVHLHNIEGFTAGCIGAIREGCPGVRIIFSLHNYHTVCPQVYLLRGGRFPCHDFDSGHACAACVPAPDPAVARRRIMGGKGPYAPVFRFIPDPVRRMLWRVPLAHLAARAIKSRLRRRPPPPQPLARDPGALHPTWVPLTNSISPPPASVRPPNAYAHRRDAMIAMLNSCDEVLAVSEFVRAKFVSMGVEAPRIRTQHIGTRLAELAAHHPRVQPRPLVGPDGRPRPIRLVFLGFNNYAKGLPMLADALGLLVPEVLRRFHLTIHAQGGETIRHRFRRLHPRLAGMGFHGGYAFEDIPRLLAGADLGVVPSVWWDNAPQTVFEFLACGVPVLGADLGGIPDFIRDGDNGILFRGNDRYDLARRLTEIARAPEVLGSLRANVRPPRTIAAHAAEVVGVYEGSRAARAGPEVAVTVRTRAPDPRMPLAGRGVTP